MTGGSARRGAAVGERSSKMKMTPASVGLPGAGAVAKQHLEHHRSLPPSEPELIPAVRLVAARPPACVGCLWRPGRPAGAHGPTGGCLAQEDAE